MAQFSKFKLLFALKLNLNESQFYKKIKFCLFQKVEKNQNKVEKNRTFAIEL